MYCSDEYLRLASARLAQKNPVFMPGRIFRVVVDIVDTLVQKSLVGGQTVDNVLVDCPLEWRERIQPFHRPGMEISNAGIHNSASRLEQDVTRVARKLE